MTLSSSVLSTPTQTHRPPLPIKTDGCERPGSGTENHPRWGGTWAHFLDVTSVLTPKDPGVVWGKPHGKTGHQP